MRKPALPEEFGFSDLKSFIKAHKQAASTKPKAKRGRKAKITKPRKGKRAKLTDEIKAAVKAGFEARKNARAIAKETGISPASVNVLKKELGLTKQRGAAAVPVMPS